MSLYLVLEGGDGTGKSLQGEQLTTWLRSRDLDLLQLREPGSTQLGEALRRILLARATKSLSPLGEALLFSAARAEMLRSEVEPALAAGKVVLAERCYLSTYVYQGLAPAAGEGVPLELLRQITARVQRQTWPDRIFILDVDEETRQQRQAAPALADRIELRSTEFHQAVRKGYLQLAAEAEASAAAERLQVVDARGSVEAVQAELSARIEGLLTSERERERE